jgi:hypothetical protein
MDHTSKIFVVAFIGFGIAIAVRIILILLHRAIFPRPKEE